MYKIFIKTSAKKEIRYLDKKEIKKILKRIKTLANNPKPIKCKKLGKGQYRIRQGDYRIIYEVFDNIGKISIVRVRHRKEVYR